MYPQRLRASGIASPHPHGRKQTSAFNKKDAQIGEKDFSQANRARMQSLSPHWHRQMEGLVHPAPQLAHLASKVESKSHSIRLRFWPRSMAEYHFLQKRIWFNQCPAVNPATSTPSGHMGTA